MVVKKRKKSARMKGVQQHGWGKCHRGSGQRGGVGMAGTGKRAHCKKPMVWGTGYLGRRGFKPKGQIFTEKPINIREIEERVERWQKKGIAAKKDDRIELDLAKAGYNKLLSAGKPTRKYSIKVKRTSKTAAEKIKQGGGEVLI